MELKGARKKIDKIDSEIVSLLIKRFNIAEEIAEYKKQNNLPIRNKQREEEIIRNAIEKFKEFKDDKFIRKLFTLIINKSISIQEKIK